MRRQTANRLRSLADDWVPAVIHDRWPFTAMTRLWLGSGSLPHFKEAAFNMSDSEFAAAYEAVRGPYADRESDTTDRQAAWVMENVGQGERILELGPGKGRLSKRLAGAGHHLVTLDLAATGNAHGHESVVGIVERLPFRDKSFDTTILCHVLEHVRRITSTLLELERVTRRKVIIVTPRQRFFRATFDYHLHFFYSLEHLSSHIPRGESSGEVIDGDLCLVWEVEG